MSAYRHLKLIVYLMLLLCACTDSTGLDTSWDVLTLGLTDRVSTSIAPINIGYYILKQTHEPLFYFSQEENGYMSRVLSHWKRDATHRNFMLCPNENNIFDSDNAFSITQLAAFMKKIIPRSFRLKEMSVEANCLNISFIDSVPQLFKYFSLYENAPEIASLNDRINHGLGHYNATIVTEQTIVLERKLKRRNGYDEIHFINSETYRGRSDSQIEDYNRILFEDLPRWLPGRYRTVEPVLLQSIVLVINHSDRTIREQIRNCLDPARIREFAFPSRKEFMDIATILPVGLPGAVAGRPKQSCLKRGTASQLRFLDWRPGETDAMHITEEFLRAIGMHVNMMPVSKKHFIDIALESPHPYDLAVVALDAVRPDYSAFYEYLVGDGPRLIDLELPEARRIYGEMLSKATIEEQRPYAERLNRILAEEAVVLPLFQEKRTFYYPRRVTDLDLGGNFLEYPDIASLKIRSGLAMLIDEAIFRIVRQIDGWFGRKVEEAP